MKKVMVMVIFVCLFGGSSCATKPRELKSPCVGAKGSPCDKRKVNEWVV